MRHREDTSSYISPTAGRTASGMPACEDVSVPTNRGTRPLTLVAVDLGSADKRQTKSADSPASVEKVNVGHDQEAAPTEAQDDTRRSTSPETDLASG